MSALSSPSTQLMLLERIRQAEQQRLQQIGAAHEQARARLHAARLQAGEIKERAQQDGQLKAEQQRKEMLAAAHTEAEQIVRQGRLRADALTSNSQAYVDALVEEAMQMLLGVPVGAESDGP